MGWGIYALGLWANFKKGRYRKNQVKLNFVIGKIVYKPVQRNVLRSTISESHCDCSRNLFSQFRLDDQGQGNWEVKGQFPTFWT